MRKFVQSIGLVIICFVINNTSLAQNQLSLRNFAVFGGDSTASFVDSLTSGIQFGFNVKVLGGGIVGTQTFLQFAANDSIVNGDVYGNIARIDTGFTLNGGSLFVFNRQGFNYNVLQEGPQPLYIFPGNITVNGNSFINASGGGVINGSVTHPAGTTYNGPSPDLGQIIATPVFPQMPKMPDSTAFPGAGTTNIFTTQTILPGIYGSMFLLPQQSLTFSGVGTYVFSSIADSTNDTLKFDFKNNATGSFKVYVAGNVDLNSINVVLLNGGDPSRIYFENHGTSFIINGTANFDANFSGIIYAPQGSVTIGNPNASNIHTNTIKGSIWSRKKVTLGLNTFVNFVQLSNSANPAPNNVILPYYPPPANGKTSTIIGSELTSLRENPRATDSIIYRISGTSVYIEVIAKQGQYNATKSFLIANGLTDTITNGPASLIITGKFPIANLLLLNAQTTLIDYARPLYYPINNIGLINSQGDTAMSSNLVRTGYNLQGEGVKVGVISDSYNTVPGDNAHIDIINGDLPGVGNPYGNTTPVDVEKEYPFPPGVDEGRAMLQIVHDVVPKSPLAFRTGFISAGDFAQGIGQLASNGCKVIVDDVTYLTEPYFKDGVIAQAVNSVVASGTSYFSAAGNFGTKSYEGTFSGIPAPGSVSGITGTVHDFGGSNPFQTLNLAPGTYTIVLQWDDNIYSVGAPSVGTQTDLDVFVLDNLNATLFGFNRNNIGGDPIEVLPFTVTANTTANIIIGKASGPNVNFKYIVFRGSANLTFANYRGSSTLVGQANSAGAIAVGAVLYSNTPPYGLPAPTIASFSSRGGAMVNGTTRFKPELTAPNGGNTSVNFNNPYNDDHDNFPNFFGTSAAAPHAAAAAALLIEGKQRFLGQTLAPADIKTLLENTAIDMGPSGYDTTNGYGFIQPFAAMQTFASPVPELDSLVTANPLTNPVSAPFTATVKGKGLTPQTKVFLSNTQLTSRFVNNETIAAEVPVFSGNPAVYLSNPSIIPAAQQTNFKDGGISDTLYFFSNKKNIVVTAKDTSKKYGEKLPMFIATITVDGVPIQNTSLTPADLKLDHLTFTTSATTSANVGNYFIHPVNPLNPAAYADSVLLTQYNYQFKDGTLSINKLPLKITPRDTTLTYGQRIHGLHYNYTIGPSNNLQNPDSLSRALQLTYTTSIIDSVLALVSGSGSTGRALVNNDLDDLSILISSGSGSTGRALVNNGNGTTEITTVVDVDVNSIFNYLADSSTSPLVSGSGSTGRALVNTIPLINGTASILVSGSGSTGRALVNGDGTLLNGTSVDATGGTSNTNVAVIVSSTDVPNQTNNIITTKPVNLLTNGIGVGTHTIVPAAFISPNYDITYGLGTLTIKKAPLTITADTKSTSNGVLPPFTSTITGYQYQDVAIPKTGPVYTLTPAYTGNAGVYTIKPSALSFAGDSDYLKTYVNGTLYVNPYTGNNQKITLSLKCVGKVTNGPSGLTYIAHFIAQNCNATTVYVPLGPDNYITATGKYSGVPPTVFPKGSTKFDVYFDGKKLTWTVKTMQGKVKCTESAVASSTSCKCSGSLSNDLGVNDIISTEILNDKTGIYPNPAFNSLIVTTNESFTNEKDITVFEADGKVMQVKATLRSAQTIELNISELARGSYFIRIKQKGKNKLIPFIKL